LFQFILLFSKVYRSRADARVESSGIGQLADDLLAVQSVGMNPGPSAQVLSPGNLP
jgi:hypothetical protein